MSNLYIDPAMNIICHSTHVLDLGVSMSSDCTFDLHISNLYTRCSNLSGCILRTFTMRDPHVMLILFKKSLVVSGVDYASPLWSPYWLEHVYLIEKVQRAFTNHITGMCYLSYSKRLELLKLYSYVVFLFTIDSYLRNIVDLPCQPGFNNSLDGGDFIHGGHYADDLADNSMQLNKHK